MFNLNAISIKAVSVGSPANSPFSAIFVSLQSIFAYINSVNSLINKYDVEIISFYKLKNNQTKKINKKVKIKYLYNGEPNKEQFLNALNNHEYSSVLKEGFISLDILIKKKLLLIDSLVRCNSKNIVSTRWEFSTLLSKYGKKNCIKIAQEHHHHNNDRKYINKLKNKLFMCPYKWFKRRL